MRRVSQTDSLTALAHPLCVFLSLQPEAVLANALGGGAVMNAMIYKRALPLDMKRWKGELSLI